MADIDQASLSALTDAEFDALREKFEAELATRSRPGLHKWFDEGNVLPVDERVASVPHLNILRITHNGHVMVVTDLDESDKRLGVYSSSHEPKPRKSHKSQAANNGD